MAILNTSNNLLHRIPIDVDTSLADLAVYNFFEDSKQNIWMATKEAGLLWFNTKTGHFVPAAAYLPRQRWKIRTRLPPRVSTHKFS